ncbi:hypothetical protein CEXT_451641 [Caerostris extrusa]|uniref:Uncharacterized protein n=1 Tax=Caerostris extrusa TaxID=172846 RepID=A0AAV4W7M4_CAEEX|nr:hypothetical protein CEXT_451641 [Caerostris extrusa]
MVGVYPGTGSRRTKERIKKNVAGIGGKPDAPPVVYVFIHFSAVGNTESAPSRWFQNRNGTFYDFHRMSRTNFTTRAHEITALEE